VPFIFKKKTQKKSWRSLMSENKPKPSRWYYVLAILLPIFACLGTGLLVYLSVPELPGALEDIGVKNLTQVVVPGSADVTFPQKGAYAIYYEYHSVIDGVSYARDEYPPMMRCQLVSKATGEAVRLESTPVKGNIYATQNPHRAAVMYRQISIDQPGTYIFSCQYTNGEKIPKSVMAVGPNMVWGFLNIAAKPIAAILCGTITFVLACGISLLIIGFVAFKRYQSKDILNPRTQS
jgi:hypothetical protein